MYKYPGQFTARDYQKKQKKPSKKGSRKVLNLSAEKTEKKNSNMVANNIKLFLNMKNQGLLTIKKIIIKCGKIKTN